MIEDRPCDVARSVEPYRSLLTEDQQQARNVLSELAEWTTAALEALAVLRGLKTYGRRGLALKHRMEVIEAQCKAGEQVWMVC